jgi:excisionase family DNA binding protein
MDCMRTREAADYLAIPVSTLTKMRLTGTGPLYVKAGRTVVYRKSDIDAWLEGRLRRSTAGQNRKANDTADART